MDDRRIQALLDDLKHPDETVRQQATQTLWNLWFQQKGMYGLQLLERSQALFSIGALESAEALLTEIITDQPDFAEAWNRRAVLHYLRGEFEASKADCQQVVVLNPAHFGAWHGLGLCYMALENYQAAIAAFHSALTIQPYALENQRLILECTAKLS